MTAATSTNYASLVNTGGASSSSSASNSAAVSSASSAYTTFLTMLSAQLKNQDPTDPTKTDTFTSQMISLSGVEQQLKANDTLSAMSSDLTAISDSNGLGYVGKTVTATGATTPLQSGTASWDYTLPSNATNVTLNVKDSGGNIVYSTSGATTSGSHSFSWNGLGSSGNSFTSGDYTLNVAASDASGGAIAATTEIVGKVTGVDTSGGMAQLQIGDITVPVSSVTMVD